MNILDGTETTTRRFLTREEVAAIYTTGDLVTLIEGVLDVHNDPAGYHGIMLQTMSMEHFIDVNFGNNLGDDCSEVMKTHPEYLPLLIGRSYYSSNAHKCIAWRLARSKMEIERLGLLKSKAVNGPL